METEFTRPAEIVPVEAPKQFDVVAPGTELQEVSALIRANAGRLEFGVNGDTTAVAVLDTGLRTTHVDFAGRVPAQANFTSDNGGDAGDASDGNGHGTNVAGIIAAGSLHIGIAPRANVIPLKVLANNGNGSFQAVEDALQWVLDNREAQGITCVCMSLGGSQNFQDDGQMSQDAIKAKIRELRDQRIAVCIAAGNDFFTHNSQQGMSYPSIIRECVSVGAVYDEEEGGFAYSSGAEAFSTGPDRLTPFSQRLHPNVHSDCRTDIFAPGAPVRSAGISSDTGESEQHGTSQATPVTAGTILLAQQLHLRNAGALPEVNDIVLWLRESGVTLNDGDNEDDNVTNTGENYPRLDVRDLLARVAAEAPEPAEC